jgi:hypothetical protein
MSDTITINATVLSLLFVACTLAGMITMGWIVHRMWTATYRQALGLPKYPIKKRATR